MRRLLITVVAVSLFASCADRNPLNPNSDNYEPDDTYWKASSIGVGSTQSHQLERNDEDWFRFSATAGNTYTMSTSSSLDTYIELYSTDGVTLLDENDDGGTDMNASLSYTFSSSGTYYFMVRGYSEGETGSYSVSLNSY